MGDAAPGQDRAPEHTPPDSPHAPTEAAVHPSPTPTGHTLHTQRDTDTSGCAHVPPQPPRTPARTEPPPPRGWARTPPHPGTRRPPRSRTRAPRRRAGTRTRTPPHTPHARTPPPRCSPHPPAGGRAAPPRSTGYGGRHRAAPGRAGGRHRSARKARCGRGRRGGRRGSAAPGGGTGRSPAPFCTADRDRRQRDPGRPRRGDGGAGSPFSPRCLCSPAAGRARAPDPASSGKGRGCARAGSLRRHRGAGNATGREAEVRAVGGAASPRGPEGMGPGGIRDTAPGSGADTGCALRGAGGDAPRCEHFQRLPELQGALLHRARAGGEGQGGLWAPGGGPGDPVSAGGQELRGEAGRLRRALAGGEGTPSCSGEGLGMA